jgi:hypothetical protein
MEEKCKACGHSMAHHYESDLFGTRVLRCSEGEYCRCVVKLAQREIPEEEMVAA